MLIGFCMERVPSDCHRRRDSRHLKSKHISKASAFQIDASTVDGFFCSELRRVLVLFG